MINWLLDILLQANKSLVGCHVELVVVRVGLLDHPLPGIARRQLLRRVQENVVGAVQVVLVKLST